MRSRRSGSFKSWVIIPAVILILASAFVVTSRMGQLSNTESNNLAPPPANVGSTSTQLTTSDTSSLAVTTGSSSSASSSSSAVSSSTSTSSSSRSSTQSTTSTSASLSSTSTTSTSTSTSSSTTVSIPSPQDVAVNPVTGMVYVASGSSSLIVMDSANNEIVATVSLSSGGYPQDVVVDTSTNMVYVTLLGETSVAVINGSTNQVATTINVQGAPYGVVVNQLTNTIYVAVTSGSYQYISVISGATETVTNSIQITPDNFEQITELALNSATNMLYVSAIGYDNGPIGDVVAINTLTGNTVAEIQIGQVMKGITINTQSNMVYVAAGGNIVSVIDGSTNNIVKNITLIDTARVNGFAIDQAKSEVFAVDSGIQSVSVISTATNTVTDTIQVGAVPLYAAFNPVTSTLYVTNFQDGTLSIVPGM